MSQWTAHFLSKLSLLSFVTLTSLSISARDIEKDTEKFLELFKNDPARAMQIIPPKYDLSGQRLKQPHLSQASKEMLFEIRDEQRKRFGLVEAGRAGIQGNDRAEDLVDSPRSMVRNLLKLDETLRSGALDTNPWSSDYWPIRTGQIAIRYQDRNFPADPHRFSWKEAYQYFQSNPSNLSTPADVNKLSPAEKYDILVGDMNFTLTKSQWAQGEYYDRQYGNVEPWMGLCHGWAVAAYVEDRPTHAVSVLAADNKTKITFLPDDIKALSVLKWSNGNYITADGYDANRFVGGRCNSKKPKTDRESGRIIDQECFDTNPGTWHLAVTHQIGARKRSIVLDATYDYEVWNHPIVSYSYSYFNPKTGRRTQKIEDATISMDDPEFEDKFTKFRDNTRVRQLVGIVMDVEYTVETSPHGRRIDRASDDATNRVRYLYDLELDARGNIVGGEWYQNAHPDFLWGVSPGAFAYNQEDRQVRSTFSEGQYMSSDIKRAARYASENARPLKVVVDALVQASQKPASER